MQHAAESRWQPGRSAEWGWGEGVSRELEEGKDRSVWHMWVAAGGEGGWGCTDGGGYDCVCWRWYQSSTLPAGV